MNWFACAALVALVAASTCFDTSDARMWRCRVPEYPWAKSVPACLWSTDPDVKGYVQLFQDLLYTDEIRNLILQFFPDANFEKINETVTRILRVWCGTVDQLGGRSEMYDFDDNVQPICHTLMYSVELRTVSFEVSAKLLARGPWGYKGAHNDETDNRDCYKICTLFRDGASVSISGLRARPTYLGCWMRENQNGEEIKPTTEVIRLDCDGFRPLPPGPIGGGGGGSVVGWVLVGLVVLALVVIVLGVVGFWFFKLRTPSAPAASTLAESFAPSINLSKA